MEYEKVVKLLHPQPSLDVCLQADWGELFQALHKFFSENYAYTRFKGIDWVQLKNEFAPRFEGSVGDNDLGAYEALREYCFRIPDGHMLFESEALSSDNIRDDIMDFHLQGSLGFCVDQLDDGTYIVVNVYSGTPADRAGLTRGSILLELDGQPVKKALDRAFTYVYSGLVNRGVSSKALMNDLRLAYATRGPADERVTLKFKTQTGYQKEAEVVFIPDDYQTTIRFTSLALPPIKTGQTSASAFHSKLIGDSGYIWITRFLDEGMMQPVRESLNDFLGQDVSSLILDLRGCMGGYSEEAAQLLGHFMTTRTLYEKLTKPDGTAQKSVWIEPRKPFFPKPIVVLVNHKTYGPGEGVAMHLKSLNSQGRRVEVVGMNSTAGSMSDIEACSLAVLPYGFSIQIPTLQSRDKSDRIQCEADGRFQGGVEPTEKIPRTADTILRYHKGEDIELEAAIDAARRIETGRNTSTIPSPRQDYQSLNNPPARPRPSSHVEGRRSLSVGGYTTPAINTTVTKAPDLSPRGAHTRPSPYHSPEPERSNDPPKHALGATSAQHPQRGYSLSPRDSAPTYSPPPMGAPPGEPPEPPQR